MYATNQSANKFCFITFHCYNSYAFKEIYLCKTKNDRQEKKPNTDYPPIACVLELASQFALIVNRSTIQIS